MPTVNRSSCLSWACALRLAALLVAALAPALPHAQAPERPAELRVQGDVKRAVTLDLAALRALPQQSATVGGKAYTGASLWDVLNLAGLAPAGSRHNPTLSMYVLAQGDDGYQALLSAGELDPAIGARTVLVAHAVDGAPLEASAGPLRLVVPADLKPARAVFRLVRLQVATAP